MKVLDLCCTQGHIFEGWFASEEDFLSQQERQLVACPVCSDVHVVRRPSAPRLNLSTRRGEPQLPVPAASAQAVSPPSAPTTPPAPTHSEVGQGGLPPQVQAALMQAVREVLQKTEDVGERFVEEARRIHYGEAQSRGIRGQATPQEREELRDEGIEVFALPVPESLKGPTH